MKLSRIVLLVALVAIGLLTRAQNSGTATSPVAPGDAATGQSAVLKILSPKSGQQLAQNFVNVKFELKNRAAVGNFPNFRVQLDGGDPVLTATPEYTFTGLAPGSHTVTVEMVDANETPITGSRTEVQFKVVSQQPPSSPSGASAASSPQLVKAALIPEAQNTSSPNQDPLPASGSSLPLLSVIGFGVLLGGIASALKTR